MRYSLLLVAVLYLTPPLYAQEPPPTDQPALTKDEQDAIAASGQAVEKANLTVSAARDLRLRADTLTGQVNSVTAVPADAEQAIRALNVLYPALLSAQQRSLLVKLSSISEELENRKGDIGKAKTNLSVGANSPREIRQASDRCDQAFAELDGEKRAAGDAATQLTGAVHGLYDYFGKEFDAADEAVKGLAGLDEAAEAPKVRQAAEQLPGFARQYIADGNLKAAWGQYAPLVAGLVGGGSGDLAKGVKNKSDNTDKDLLNVLKKLKTWFATLKTLSASAATNLNSLTSGLQADFVTTYPGADSAIRDAKELRDQVWKAVNAWNQLSTRIPAPDPGGFDRAGTEAAVKDLLAVRQQAGDALLRADDALSAIGASGKRTSYGCITSRTSSGCSKS